MSKIIHLNDFKRCQQQKDEQKIMAEIELDFTNYNIAIEALENMPKALVIRTVLYCLTNLINISDLKKKFDY